MAQNVCKCQNVQIAMSESVSVTPTKSYSRKGRKPKAATVDDYCRACKCSLKNKNGSLGSFVNVFKVTNRNQLKGLVIADVCEQSGIQLRKSPSLSTRICPSCTRKIKTFADLYSFISSRINTSTEAEAIVSTDETITKRIVQLTPGKSPSRKARRIVEEAERVETPVDEKPVCRRLILSYGEKEHNDNLRSHMNIEDIVNSETTRVKVLILSPNGDIKVTTPQDKATTGIVKNIALKKWKAATNAFISHKNVLPELMVALKRSVNREFKAFCKMDTVLKGRSADELAAFSNKLLAKEAEVYLPFWNACVRGSCGEKVDENKATALQAKVDEGLEIINTVALTTATVARQRVKNLSAFHYRVSTVLCHSGVSFDGAVLLNKLGVCMSPQRMVSLQRAMGKDHDAKLQMWKREVQENESACKLLQEVVSKQLPQLAEDDMELNRTVDLSEESLQQYRFYSKDVLGYCLTLIEPIKAQLSECEMTEDVIKTALDVLKGQEIPYYK